MGDFAMSKDGKISNNTRIPLNWYIEVIENLRKKNNNIKVYIFSDGDKNELGNFLKIKNLEIETSDDPALDILKLSESKIFIGSYSSFSFWSAFFQMEYASGIRTYIIKVSFLKCKKLYF